MVRYSRGPKPRFRKRVFTYYLTITNALAEQILFTVAEGQEETIERIIADISVVMNKASAAGDNVIWMLKRNPGGVDLAADVSTNIGITEPKEAREIIFTGRKQTYLQGSHADYHYDIKSRRKLEPGDNLVIQGISGNADWGHLSFNIIIISRVK